MNNYSSPLVNVMVIILFFSIPATTHAWLDGYSARKSITIQADNVDDDLTDFPVYVPISSDSEIGGVMKDTTNYYDIRFTDTDDNILPYEVELMSIAGGVATGSYWVKTDLASTTDSTIYVYYGKSGDTDGSSSESVWNSGYEGVWHLSEGDSTASDFYKDSTSNNNDGTLTDSNGDVTATSTNTGQGINFIGTTNDRIVIGNDTSLDVTSTYTLSGWVKLDSYDASGYSFLIAKDNYPNGGSYDLGLRTNKPYTAINTNPTGASWTTHTLDDVTPLDSWQHFTAVRNNDNTLDYYLNGVLDTTFTGVATPAVSTTAVTLGLRSSDTLQLHGSIDELRIESVSRESEWIKFTHANMGGESDYEISFSMEEEEVVEEEVVDSVVINSESTSVARSSSRRTYGCKDKSASNYNYFSSHKQSLCEYDAPTQSFVSVESTKRDLQKGMSGEDVLELQKTLNTIGFVVATEGAGSVGNETDYFGILTQQAVLNLQNTLSINPSDGIVKGKVKEILNLVAVLGIN